MVPVCSSVMLELVLAVHSYHVIAYPDTGSLLTRVNFDKLFGFLYFNLTYKSNSITADPKQIVLRYKLSSAPTAGSNYKVHAIILYEEEVRIDPIGNEILII